MDRFTLKIAGAKKLSTEDLFPHEKMGFHPEPDEISDILDGISFSDALETFKLLEFSKIKLVDNHLGLEWEFSGFGWNLISSSS